MKVRAKMVCNSITKTGSPQKPNISVQLGAVYSADPESENKSFAAATPSANLTLNIDAGMPAASAFELGGHYYVDLIPCGVPERVYVKDNYPAYSVESEVVLSSRDKSVQRVGKFKEGSWFLDGERLSNDGLIAKGLEFWQYAPELSK